MQAGRHSARGDVVGHDKLLLVMDRPAARRRNSTAACCRLRLRRAVHRHLLDRGDVQPFHLRLRVRKRVGQPVVGSRRDHHRAGDFHESRRVQRELDFAALQGVGLGLGLARADRLSATAPEAGEPAERPAIASSQYKSRAWSGAGDCGRICVLQAAGDDNGRARLIGF